MLLCQIHLTAKRWLMKLQIVHCCTTKQRLRKETIKLLKKTLHSTSEDAARVAKEANVGSLLLGHFSNRYRDLSTLLNETKEVFKNSELSQEGKTYSLN